MENTTFKHSDPDHCHGKTLTLHDCIANKVCFANGILRFFLPDGLWVTSHHDDNNLNKTVRTDAAIVDFSVKDIDDVTVRVFTRNTWLCPRKTSVEIWHMEQLISAVNNGKYTIEFITQYRTHFEQMWLCAIRSKKKPCYRECQLHLPETQATFRWNELRPEREW